MSEVTFEDVKEYCRRRCLIIMDGAMYEKTKYSDVVPVVRCKDCEHMDWSVGGCCTNPKSPWKKTAMDALDYCSKAERRP